MAKLYHLVISWLTLLYFLLMITPVQLAIDIGKEFKLKPETEEGISETPGYGSLGEFISSILPNVYVIASLILFLLLLGGGLTMITSAGDPEKQAQGQKALTSSIIGFIIIFVSYWLIKLIEYLTGIKIFSPNI